MTAGADRLASVKADTRASSTHLHQTTNAINTHCPDEMAMAGPAGLPGCKACRQACRVARHAGRQAGMQGLQGMRLNAAPAQTLLDISQGTHPHAAGMKSYWANQQCYRWAHHHWNLDSDAAHASHYSPSRPHLAATLASRLVSPMQCTGRPSKAASTAAPSCC
jgi:hypothetical protein